MIWSNLGPNGGPSMSATKRRVDGFDYLYQRGHSYEVRVQVPRGLRPIVGKGELGRNYGAGITVPVS